MNGCQRLSESERKGDMKKPGVRWESCLWWGLQQWYTFSKTQQWSFTQNKLLTLHVNYTAIKMIKNQSLGWRSLETGKKMTSALEHLSEQVFSMWGTGWGVRSCVGREDGWQCAQGNEMNAGIELGSFL
jgi:hypothetical protein